MTEAKTDPIEAAKKTLAEQREASDKARAERDERMAKAKPTPTQEECDLAALGVHVSEKEDDGSGPDPHAPKAEAKNDKPQAKHAEAKKPGSTYQTRSSHPE